MLQVASVVGRADVLAGLFFLCAILVYRRALTSSSRKWFWLFFALLCTLSSALSKEIGVMATALCLLYDYFIHNKMSLPSLFPLLAGLRRGQRPTWFSSFIIRALVVSTCAIIFLVFRFQLNQGSPKFTSEGNPAMFFPTSFRQLHWAYLIFYNLRLLLLPSPLCAEYSLSTIPPISSLADHRNILTLLTFATIFKFSFLGFVTPYNQLPPRIRMPLILGVCLMVFPFLPASNLFFPVGFVIAERVLYIPSMGFCLLVAMGAWRLHTLYPNVVKVGIVYLLFVHSIKTVVRNRDWKTSKSLYQSAVVALPNNGKMWSHLATTVRAEGDKVMAVELYNLSTKLEPTFITGYSNLAYTLRELGNMAEALHAYQKAADLVTRASKDKSIAVTGKAHRAYNSLSNMLREEVGDGKGALKYAQRAIEWEPEWENGYHSKANALVFLGQLQQARVAFEKALKLNPNVAVMHSNYGDCMQKLGFLGQAEESYRRSLDLNFNHSLTKFRLAALISTVKKSTPEELVEAEKLLKMVHDVEPQNGNVTSNLGIVYTDLQRDIEAIKYFKLTLDIAPKDNQTLYNLGLVLTRNDRYEEAIDYMEMLVADHPYHLRAQSQLATCYMQTNRTELAKKTFDLALKLNPMDPTTLQNYGVLCVKEKENKKALELFERLLQIQPDNKQLHKQIQLLKRKI